MPSGVSMPLNTSSQVRPKALEGEGDGFTKTWPFPPPTSCLAHTLANPSCNLGCAVCPTGTPDTKNLFLWGGQRALGTSMGTQASQRVWVHALVLPRALSPW